MQQLPGHTSSNPLDLPIPFDQLLDAARLPISPDVKQRAPRFGRLGGCAACHQGVHTHFDAIGRFVGCTAAGEDTVFILVPISATSQPAASTPPRRTRQFRAARYFPTMPKGTILDDLHLSDRRKQVLQAVKDAGKQGARATELTKRSGLAAGSVAEALNWLRAQALIDAREDDPPSK